MLRFAGLTSQASTLQSYFKRECDRGGNNLVVFLGISVLILSCLADASYCGTLRLEVKFMRDRAVKPFGLRIFPNNFVCRKNRLVGYSKWPLAKPKLSMK